MAWFYCFLFKCQTDSVSHTGQNSLRQKHTKQSKSVVFIYQCPEWCSDKLVAAATMIQVSRKAQSWCESERTSSAPPPTLNFQFDWSETDLILLSTWLKLRPPGGSTEPDRRPLPCRRRFLSGRWGLSGCQTQRSVPCPTPELCRRGKTGWLLFRF